MEEGADLEELLSVNKKFLKKKYLSYQVLFLSQILAEINQSDQNAEPEQAGASGPAPAGEEEDESRQQSLLQLPDIVSQIKRYSEQSYAKFKSRRSDDDEFMRQFVLQEYQIVHVLYQFLFLNQIEDHYDDQPSFSVKIKLFLSSMQQIFAEAPVIYLKIIKLIFLVLVKLSKNEELQKQYIKKDEDRALAGQIIRKQIENLQNVCIDQNAHKIAMQLLIHYFSCVNHHPEMQNLKDRSENFQNVIDSIEILIHMCYNGYDKCQNEMLSLLCNDKDVCIQFFNILQHALNVDFIMKQRMHETMVLLILKYIQFLTENCNIKNQMFFIKQVCDPDVLISNINIIEKITTLLRNILVKDADNKIHLKHRIIKQCLITMQSMINGNKEIQVYVCMLLAFSLSPPRPRDSASPAARLRFHLRFRICFRSCFRSCFRFWLCFLLHPRRGRAGFSRLAFSSLFTQFFMAQPAATRNRLQRALAATRNRPQRALPATRNL